ncbi:hypothetical protein F5879DRAFT_939292 [Lentinula edodes]|uniref:uncharacterized protein n=1 Tax=Lentinula edodes TaxID=5353 RepID=UPI001E8EE1D5|nr:uncharacterized protein C8R40DRAFT_1136627 [Lentinula edodes]KAH7868017.1 hypothetical protein C8R40DRAFT_1136627 [Lentinula edodes]KAJ3908025.1 hypothetical protein F5879DRAFT_939292 [Lentinula edodes]
MAYFCPGLCLVIVCVASKRLSVHGFELQCNHRYEIRKQSTFLPYTTNMEECELSRSRPRDRHELGPSSVVSGASGGVEDPGKEKESWRKILGDFITSWALR